MKKSEHISDDEKNYRLALKKINDGDTAEAYKMLYQRPDFLDRTYRDLVKAELIKKLEEQLTGGDKNARWRLCDCYRIDNNPRPEKAIALYLPQAEQGDEHAQCFLADIYFNVLNDEASAIEWWKRAASQGNEFAEEALKDIERNKTKRVKVGIFWAVPDGKGGETVLKISKTCGQSEADSLGFVNYRYSHFDMWDYVRKNRTDDCYEYPRGRVIFDVNECKHIIYADKCIKRETIEEVIQLFDAEAYEIRQDEHYVCKNCGDKND